MFHLRKRNFEGERTMFRNGKMVIITTIVSQMF